MKKLFALALAATISIGLSGTTNADLVAHWPLNDGGNDVAGGHDADFIAESVTFDSPGKFGNAASFAGSGGIQVPFSADLNPESFSLTAWVNPADTAGWNSVVTSREDNGSTVNGYILYNTPENQWDFWTGGGGAPGTWGRDIGPNGALDTWSHLAITYDGSTDTKILWLDGENAAEVSGQGYVPNGSTDPESARPFNIGAGEDFGTNFFFNGLIDDIGLFNSALSQGEIQSVMANGVPEPSSALLAIVGMLSLLSLRRRKA
ncbi:MAG: LamG domain-containing protein [Planctomycetaceae bacterium]|nr:LamG domain-containing protein [Planctomycetaceae bacterium]